MQSAQVPLLFGKQILTIQVTFPDNWMVTPLPTDFLNLIHLAFLPKLGVDPTLRQTFDVQFTEDGMHISAQTPDCAVYTSQGNVSFGPIYPLVSHVVFRVKNGTPELYIDCEPKD